MFKIRTNTIDQQYSSLESMPYKYSNSMGEQTVFLYSFLSHEWRLCCNEFKTSFSVEGKKIHTDFFHFEKVTPFAYICFLTTIFEWSVVLSTTETNKYSLKLYYFAAVNIPLLLLSKWYMNKNKLHRQSKQT